MKQNQLGNITRGLLAVSLGFIFATSAQAGPGGHEAYVPVKTLQQAQAIQPGQKIAIACGRCGTVTTAIADQDRSYLRGYVCATCRMKFVTRTSPHGGTMGTFVYEDEAGHHSKLMVGHQTPKS